MSASSRVRLWLKTPVQATQWMGVCLCMHRGPQHSLSSINVLQAAMSAALPFNKQQLQTLALDCGYH